MKASTSEDVDSDTETPTDGEPPLPSMSLPSLIRLVRRVIEVSDPLNSVQSWSAVALDQPQRTDPIVALKVS